MVPADGEVSFQQGLDSQSSLGVKDPKLIETQLKGPDIKVGQSAIH